MINMELFTFNNVGSPKRQDFSAMYPSIIIAHNLSYETYLLPPPAPPPDVPYEQHNGQRFVTAAVVKGLLPCVVQHLGDCRSKAKAAYAAATDPMQKRICKARELAFKVREYDFF